MKSVSSIPALRTFGSPLSIKTAAGAVGIPRPVSLKLLLRHLTEKKFTAAVSTPDPDALGGNVSLTIRADGTYDLSVAMHDSGAPDYSYRLTMLLNIPVYTLSFYSHGTTHGTFSSGSRDSSDHQSGFAQVLVTNWDDFVEVGAFSVQREYKDNFVSWIESTLLDIVTFVIGCATVGGPAACLIVCGSAFGEITKKRLPGELGLAGLIAAEGSFVFCGPTMFIPVFVGSALVSAALLKRRSLHADEIDAARSVFQDTVPYDRVMIVNLNGPSGRAFATPSVDGEIVIGVGPDRFDSLLTSTDTRRTLIHELTHAWQFEHNSALESICTGLSNRISETEHGQDEVYNPKTISAPWGSYNTEQQAVIIATADELRQALIKGGLSTSLSPFEHFIQENIISGFQ